MRRRRLPSSQPRLFLSHYFGAFCGYFQQRLGYRRNPSRLAESRDDPLSEAGSKPLANDYMPTGLTSIQCKVLEWIIRDLIIKYFNWLLHIAHYDLFAVRSCITSNEYRVQDPRQWCRSWPSFSGLRCGCQCEAGVLRVHPILMPWTASFLVNRSLRINLAPSVSNEVLGPSAVSQGLVIGPLVSSIGKRSSRDIKTVVPPICWRHENWMEYLTGGCHLKEPFRIGCIGIKEWRAPKHGIYPA